MNTKAFRWWVATLLFGCSVVSNGMSQTKNDEARQTWAEEIIKKVVTEIKASPEAGVYLDDVDVHKLSFIHHPALPNQEGWSVQWNYEKEVSLERNPPTEQRVYIAKVHTPTGILLHLYVAYAQGYLMIDTTKAFDINLHPKYVIGYYLVKKDANEVLTKRIEQIIKTDIPALQKTVPNH